MPEGPELNLTAQFVNQTCRDRIFSGHVLKSAVSRRPDINWNEESYVITASSHGKELKLNLQSISSDTKQLKKIQNKTLDIIFQFGMSGKFDFYDASELQKHAHLNFFTKVSHPSDTPMVLSFVDYRRFGKWQPNGNWSPERGPCVLTEYTAFRNNVLRNVDTSVFNKPICEVLLNQKYFNGIGNYLRAEICYRAGIKPFQSARSVLEPLLAVSKVKSEEPDVLLLCHVVANEVLTLDGTGYDPENREPDYSKFTEWLQCYNKAGMKNMADHNKRTMWYHGDPGPMTPSNQKQRSIKRKVKKSKSDDLSKKIKIEETRVKQELKRTTDQSEVKGKGRITRSSLTAIERVKKIQKEKPTKKPGKTNSKIEEATIAEGTRTGRQILRKPARKVNINVKKRPASRKKKVYVSKNT